MDPILVIEMLTNEIITKFCLPRTLCYNFIYRRVERALGAGYDLGRGVHHSSAKKIIQMDINGIEIKVWDSAAAAARSLRIDASSVAKYARNFHKYAQEGFKTRCKNHYRTYGGYRWRYVEDKK